MGTPNSVIAAITLNDIVTNVEMNFGDSKLSKVSDGNLGVSL
jgi:hypothetical protein